MSDLQFLENVEYIKDILIGRKIKDILVAKDYNVLVLEDSDGSLDVVLQNAADDIQSNFISMTVNELGVLGGIEDLVLGEEFTEFVQKYNPLFIRYVDESLEVYRSGSGEDIRIVWFNRIYMSFERDADGETVDKVRDILNVS